MVPLSRSFLTIARVSRPTMQGISNSLSTIPEKRYCGNWKACRTARAKRMRTAANGWIQNPRANAVVADHRVRHHHALPGIGRIGQNFKVPVIEVLKTTSHAISRNAPRASPHRWNHLPEPDKLSLASPCLPDKFIAPKRAKKRSGFGASAGPRCFPRREA